ncbi:unnamed protein product [Lupinus luteus]|uniref:Polygalacturonase n=1 Tax=Lupinus luteus TaxID=3873 RepID=A0AAV1XN35_LUPLU
MDTKLSVPIFTLFLFLASYVRAQTKVFDVTKYGARPNTDISNALTNAWKDACGSTTSSKVLVPKGTYMLNKLDLKGPCRAPINIHVDGNILAPKDPKLLNGVDQWVKFGYINFFTLSGGGTFDGQGEMTWKQNDCGPNKNCHIIPMNFGFAFLSNSIIHGITSKDSKYFHVNVLGCNNLTFINMNINAPATSPNTDGIHIGRSTQVHIYNSNIGTGDDCISLGDGSKQIHVQNVTCGPGHGISVGSLGKYPNEEPIEGFVVKNCTLKNTDNGVRIKTWPGTPIISSVSNMHFEDIIMVNVRNPIIIDQQYCPWNQCTKQALTNAWKDACRSTTSSKVVVPKGTYMLNKLDLKGPCKAPINVQVDGNILAPKDPKLLNGVDQSKNKDGKCYKSSNWRFSANFHALGAAAGGAIAIMEFSSLSLRALEAS